MVTSPSGPSASPWVSVISVPAWPRFVSRTRPLMFWPRSTRCTPGRSSVTATGRTSSTGRTGGAGEQTSASYPRSLTATGCQCAASYRVVRPAPLQQPAVLALALDQVGGQDVRVRPAPGGVGPEDGGAAVVVLEVQLGEERGLLAPLVGGAEDPDLAAVPPVGEQRAEHVGSRARGGR